LDLHHVELPLLHDVDEPADLTHVPASWLRALPGVTQSSP
jgi:glycosyltransferase A (GT-A) superfamily protein (DUF2064 family)